ncbi:MAG: UDP-N-acetylmuramate dehydrogenase [Candidatus Doudnabacteria bacterium]
MNPIPNKLLSELTTFRIGGPAEYYVSVPNLAELRIALDFAKSGKLSVFILGGGSNLLVSDQGFRGLVISLDIKSFEVTETAGGAELKIGAGENWDAVVERSISMNLWGIENLSDIPGSMGAAPVQNIGAYGQEVSQTIKSVEVLDVQTGKVMNFAKNQCGFAYRQSYFNTVWKNRFAILSVTLALSKNGLPNLTYFDVKKYFERVAHPNPGLLEIRNAIIEIRKNKFPDLSALGTAGSFFKNLLITEDQYDLLEENVRKNFSAATAARLAEIKDKFPQVGGIKIPTAYLIDICGLKGKVLGGVRLWERQALVIVNQGQAKATDVAGLFKFVRQKVYAKTGMEIMPEPELVGFGKEELENYFSLTI